MFFTYSVAGDIVSKESFKSFAREHTELADYVLRGKTSWQRLYELYEIYGARSSIWDDYFSTTNLDSNSRENDVSDLSSSLKDLVGHIKNIDLDSVQKGISNIQKALGVLQDIGVGQTNPVSTYEPRPLYQHFDD